VSSSPSVSRPSGSYGAPSAPPSASSNGDGKPDAPGPNAADPETESTRETTEACALQGRAGFWQGLLRVLRSVLAFVFRLRPPSPPGKLP
jgi:hypothetical protein